MMPFLRGIVASTLLLAAAGIAPAATFQQEAVCNTPPCTHQELQRYETKLIKRLQKANKLSVEARERGEIETADRLQRVFQRSFDRRRAVQQAMRSTPE